MTQEKALKILQSGRSVFLTGEPGSGKTYTINQFTKWLRSKGKRYAVTATTGIASTHINGSTIHSWTGMGIKETITDEQLSAIAEKPWIGRKILNNQVLIIDEISMLNEQSMINIDRILSFCKNTLLSGIPFGGMQVVFVGDFFQLPPVKKGNLAFESDAWKRINPAICYLTEQHRQNDIEFLDILTAMRSGKITKEHVATLLKTSEGKRSETILYTHNNDVDNLNDEKLEALSGEEHTYEMTSEGTPYLVEVLKKSCLSPETLRLKEGAVVMFTRNNFDIGYVNGTLGVVIGFDEENKMPIVETKDGNLITGDYAEWRIEDTDVTITQIPLKLAWAITVHKSQGLSLDEATIDLSKAFEHGQGYVAISRVRSLKGLFLEGINAYAFRMHPKVVIQDKIFREQSELIDKEY